MTRSTGERYRRKLGGLDNAVAQADSRDFHRMNIIDIDCHINEPFSEFSDYLSENWRKEYSNSRVLSESDSFENEYKIFTDTYPTKGVDPVKMKLLNEYYEIKRHSIISKFDLTVGGRIRRSEINFNHLSGMKREQIVDTFVNRMQDIGIKRSIIFPNHLLNIGSHPDNDFEVAISNAFIDYMIDQFLDKYPELLSCILLPANSPERSADLIDRVGSERGVVGAMITAHRPTLAGDESWIPIYQAARRKNLPICFHASERYVDPFDKLKTLLAFHAIAFPFNLILQLTSLVTEGIPERFPDLKFVFIEGGVTWIPWIMSRLDSVYMMRRSEGPALKRMPSDYIKEFFFSSQPLENNKQPGALEFAFKSFNAETQLMYASDYPHHDFDVPSVIYNLPFLSVDAKKKILGENAQKIFRIG